MSRGLQILNLIGVAALAALSAWQWQANRATNLEAIRLEKIRIEHEQKIADQEKAIQGCNADLDAFRAQLAETAKARKEADNKLEAAGRENARLVSERDQLKENVDRWHEAVSERDARLKEASAQIQTLAGDRNAAVTKFNELAEKYNAAVQALNDRTRDYNGLVEKYNALAKRGAGQNSSSTEPAEK